MMDWEPRVGMRVVCLDADPLPGRLPWGDCERPSVGTVYTISAVFVDFEGDVVLEFQELSRARASRELGERLGYAPRRFRPLDERRLEIFRSILTKAPTEKEPA